MKGVLIRLLVIFYMVAPASSGAMADTDGVLSASTATTKAEAPGTDAGSCYVIADADAKAYCLAKAHGNFRQCFFIQDSGLRSQCLAEMRK